MALTPPALPATYSGDPLSSPTDEVRFLVGDTDADAFYLSDADAIALGLKVEEYRRSKR